ncbi:MAG: succinate dehydrogenase [Rhodobacter sp.]|nr:succinate dehydrogenase [Rhodobacter sp.]
MINRPLFIIQRLSALVMVPLVFGHLALMIYAVQGGLSVDEILGRTQGSWFWFCYYGVFVLAASVHGAIGLRTICGEWLGLRRGLDMLTWLVAASLTCLGLWAVVAVT